MRAVIVLAGAVVFATTSCSSDSGGAPTTSGIEAAMASVSGTGAATSYFEYGDIERMRELGIVHPVAEQTPGKSVVDVSWQRVAGIGASSLASYWLLLPKAIGLDLFSADTAVTIGNPPNTAVRLDGELHRATITAKLTALGAKPRDFAGTSGLSFAPDNKIDFNSPLTAKLNLVNQLDQIVVTDHQFAASPNAATLELARGKGTSLLNSAHYRDVASCLGDVVAATMTAGAHGDNAAVVAVGVRDPASVHATRTEVLCALPRAGQDAAVKAALTKNLTLSSTDPYTNAPISTYATRSAVDTSGPVVRVSLTMKSSTPAGYLLTALERNAQRYWDGTCTVQQVAARTC